jgi:hypothetical protein
MCARKRVNGIITTIVITIWAFYMMMQLVSTNQVAANKTNEENNVFFYFPVVYSQASPVGSYICHELEWGLIWYSEVITLHEDGSSVYDYSPPYLTDGMGTWQYSSLNQIVTFTNFTWPTATFEIPDRLWASRQVVRQDSDFEVALRCLRTE